MTLCVFVGAALLGGVASAVEGARGAACVADSGCASGLFCVTGPDHRPAAAAGTCQDTKLVFCDADHATGTIVIEDVAVTFNGANRAQVHIEASAAGDFEEGYDYSLTGDATFGYRGNDSSRLSPTEASIVFDFVAKRPASSEINAGEFYTVVLTCNQ
jgi:hypothetical protein